MASFWSNVFGQSTTDSEPSASVLAEWNKYSTDAAGNLQAFHWWLFAEPRSVLPAPMTRILLNCPPACKLPPIWANLQVHPQYAPSPIACWARWRRGDPMCRTLCQRLSRAYKPERKAWVQAWAPPCRGVHCAHTLRQMLTHAVRMPFVLTATRLNVRALRIVIARFACMHTTFVLTPAAYVCISP